MMIIVFIIAQVRMVANAAGANKRKFRDSRVIRQKVRMCRSASWALRPERSLAPEGGDQHPSRRRLGGGRDVERPAVRLRVCERLLTGHHACGAARRLGIAKAWSVTAIVPWATTLTTSDCGARPIGTQRQSDAGASERYICWSLRYESIQENHSHWRLRLRGH